MKQVNAIDFLNNNESNSFASYSTTGEDTTTEMNDISIECTYFSSTVASLKSFNISCNNVVPIMVSIEEGRKCLTIFSDIQGQLSQINVKTQKKYYLEYERFPLIKVIVKGKLLTNPPTESSFFSNDILPNVTNQMDDFATKTNIKSKSGLFIGLHNPKLMTYMNEITMHRIQPGKNFDIRFEKKVEVLKEPPYTTKCFKYSPMRQMKPDQLDQSSLFGRYTTTRSGLAIYRSRGECFVYCIWRTINSSRCINIYSIFMKDLVMPSELYWQRVMNEGGVKQINWNVFNQNGKIRFCSPTNRSLSEYLYYKQQCLNQCNKACVVNSFSMGANILDSDAPNPNISIIDIQWAPNPYTFLSHKEKLNLNEFLGTLGGHAHIWLGLSMIHIIKYLVNLLKTFLLETSCRCLTYRWKLSIHQA